MPNTSLPTNFRTHTCPYQVIVEPFWAKNEYNVLVEPVFGQKLALPTHFRSNMSLERFGRVIVGPKCVGRASSGPTNDCAMTWKSHFWPHWAPTTNVRVIVFDFRGSCRLAFSPFDLFVALLCSKVGGFLSTVLKGLLLDLTNARLGCSVLVQI